MRDFNKIVKNLGKKGGKVMFRKDIFDLVDPECKQEYSVFVDKLIYRLKAEGYIIVLKSGVYIIPDESDIKRNSIDLIEKYYIRLLKKYITQTVGSQYYISGSKSLEFHMKDYSTPSRIYVMNRGVNKKIQIGNYEIIFKTISGKFQGKKLNLFAKFFEYTQEIETEEVNLKISCLELALLEAALVSDSCEGLDTHILMRAIKKYGSVMSEEIFRELGKYKYNMSFNRLKEISKTMDIGLYKIFLDIIKTNGGCFVGEGLRGI